MSAWILSESICWGVSGSLRWVREALEGVVEIRGITSGTCGDAWNRRIILFPRAQCTCRVGTSENHLLTCKLSTFHREGKFNSVPKKWKSPQYLFTLKMKAWVRINISVEPWAWGFFPVGNIGNGLDSACRGHDRRIWQLWRAEFLLQTVTNNPGKICCAGSDPFQKGHWYEIGRKSSLLKKSSSILVTSLP